MSWARANSTVAGRRICGLTLVLLLLLMGWAPSAGADDTQVTDGWAGYVVRAGAFSFAQVHARWAEPRVVCNRPGSAAAFWVGLGGAGRESRALEQVGTSADCSSRAQVSYSAWYQLWPAQAVELPLAVRRGDVVDAAVKVDGTTVTIALRNLSTGAATRRATVMWEPETDSAEWIAEAPAMCFATCTLLPLATFGRVTFTKASATFGAHTGTIDDARWSTSRFTIGSATTRAVATPSALAEGGSSFAVLRSRSAF